MTREELKEHCERQVQQFERVEKIMAVTPNDWKRYEEHKLILELLEPEPCEDAVSRQAIINTLDNMDKALDEDRTVENYKELLKECYEVLPSVTARPKKGHWEYVPYDSNPNIGNWHCSECNRIVCGVITAASPVYSYNYCPNCGADMRKESD